MNEIVTLLQKLTDQLYHYQAPPNARPPYLVYQETAQGEVLSGDDAQEEYAATGTVDVYSHAGREPLVRAVYQALNENEISFYVKSVQYEQDTRLIHTEIEFDVIGGAEGWRL